MHKKEAVDLFFNAGLSPAQVRELQNHLRQCAECAAYFESSLALDRVLLEQGSPARLTDGEWDSLVQKAVGVTNPSPVRLTDAEWNHLVNSALRHVRPRKLLLFPWTASRLTALAAALLLSIGAFFYFRSTAQAPAGQTVVAAPPQAPVSPVSGLRPGAPLSLGKGCAGVGGAGSRLRVTDQSPTATALALDTGLALFEVTPGAYRRLSVETPDAVVEVLGTRFGVWVEAGHTRVLVFRGRVQVRSKGTGKHAVINKNQAISLGSFAAGVRPLYDGEREAVRLLSDALPSTVPTAPPALVSAQNEAPAKTPWPAQLNRALTFAEQGTFDSSLFLLDGIKRLPDRNSTVQAAWYRSGNLKIKALGKPREGADDLVQYLQLFPDGIYAEEASLDLLGALRALGDGAAWLTAAEKFSRRFPGHPQAADLLYQTATEYRDRKKDFQAAASLYHHFLAQYPSDAKAEDALFWLGACRARCGDRRAADSLWSKYDVDFPQGKWRREIRSLRSAPAVRP